MLFRSFHVPAPDAVVFEERWDKGEYFRSGMTWQVGTGKVFYYRPGHETYPVYRQPEVVRVLANAVMWAHQDVPWPADTSTCPNTPSGWFER